MGVKYLWNVLTPHAERKPISELRGKTVAVDLAGWVCESLNVVDYFVHPRHHLKNLFFRTCYLIWQDVTPVFVLEGVAPKLKSKVIEKRNEIQFRGVKQKKTNSEPDDQKPKGDKCRTRFNHVLKQCENLLHAMGIQCVQGPSEAEAYCAFLNSKGLVDGVISQDSDCFAYGALRVYRNFSVSSQGALAAQGGAVDIYDMNNICSKMDFGRNKVIVMALLCGCDYCPEGIAGVGRDSVLHLFSRYKNEEILKRVRNWRFENDNYTTLEMRVEDKNICTNCGHLGRTQSHTKNGCGICRTNHGCDEGLWREERLSLKAELTLRKKALADPSFPSEEIIEEFLNEPKQIPKLQLHWFQPNMVKFIKQVGDLLQWTEIYSFQKFLPILARWEVLNATRLKDLTSAVTYIRPKEVIKKRVVKGVPCLELLWEEEGDTFKGLIPDSQLKEFLDNNPNGFQEIWSTVEPFDKVKIAFPSLVESFLISKEKPKKISKKTTKAKSRKVHSLESLENLNDLIEVTSEITKSLQPKRKTKTKKCNTIKGIQMIDKFCKQKNCKAIEERNQETPTKCMHKSSMETKNCSTPITENIPSDLESDAEQDAFDMSDIVNGIIHRSHRSFALTSHKGKQLCYETVAPDISILLNSIKDFTSKLDRSVDDFDVPGEKRSLSNCFNSMSNEAKRKSMDDSFDVLVKMGSRNTFRNKLGEVNCLSALDRLKQKERMSVNFSKNSLEKKNEMNTSYFFNNSYQLEGDAFESLMETSLGKPNLDKADFLF